MARKQLYSYNKDGVKLEFSFGNDEEGEKAKAVFLGLLKEATEELTSELNGKK